MNGLRHMGSLPTLGLSVTETTNEFDGFLVTLQPAFRSIPPQIANHALMLVVVNDPGYDTETPGRRNGTRPSTPAQSRPTYAN